MRQRAVQERNKYPYKIPPRYRPTADTGAFRFGQAAQKQTAVSLWEPNPDHDDGTPNPQRLALESEADEVFYGGQAGGGKTYFLIGCAATEHTQSIIFRRTSPNLKSIIRKSKKMLGDDNYKIQAKYHDLGNGRFLEFGYMQYEDDKKNWQGQDYDFYGFDEITEFTRTQYQFVTGWNRSDDPNQRCRIVCAGNPPIDQDGAWVIEEWSPWLDETSPNPAKPGQLMWYTYDDNGRLQWSYEQRSDWQSRTFIPATLADNPHLAADGRYLARLNSYPEPLRSAFRDGDFKILTRRGNPFQIIPLAHIRAAQARWRERERPEGNPDAAGHDVSRGGQDATTLIERWGNYFDITGNWPGVTIPDGIVAAAKVHEVLDGRNPDVINVDIIGYGSASHDQLVTMGYNCEAVNVAHASTYTDKSGKFRMKDLRTELVWRMRDALHPDSGLDIALPDDPEVTADLCCYTYKPLGGGVVRALSKDEIKKALGRSPDVGDGILLAQLEQMPLVVF